MRQPLAAERGGTALPAALIALAVSAALGAAVADLVRTEVVLARQRRAAASALAATDACVATTLAGLPPGWGFAPELAGADGRAGTADDGLLPVRSGCLARARPAPGPASPPRVLVSVGGRAGAGRRAVDVVVGRDPAPGLPALLWLSGTPAGGAITGTLALDGADVADPAFDWAGLAAPGDVAALDAWLAGEAAVTQSPRTLPPITAPAPPLAALAALARTAAPGGPLLVSSGTPPETLAYVAGDLSVGGTVRGAGCLFVDGALDITGTFDFTGLVVASNGVRIESGASLAIDGALWVGATRGPGSLVSVAGTLGLRQGRAALAAADRLLVLPRRATLLGLRDLG